MKNDYINSLINLLALHYAFVTVIVNQEDPKCHLRKLRKLLRYQCTTKLTILPNYSFLYSQVHLIEFFQLQKVLRKKVSPRQSYNEKTTL